MTDEPFATYATVPALAQRGVRLRAEESDDSAFLAGLYASTREEELRSLGWSAQQKAAFLDQQFRAQTMHYDRFYADAARGVILVHGVRAGRLYLLQGKHDLRIVDISLLPEYRAQGIGSALIRAVFDQAISTRSKVSIHVEIFNPARRLYERLGFVQAGDAGVYILMEWYGDEEHQLKTA